LKEPADIIGDPALARMWIAAWRRMPDGDAQVFHIEQPDKHDQIRPGAVAAERDRRRRQGGLGTGRLHRQGAGMSARDCFTGKMAAGMVARNAGGKLLDMIEQFPARA
jgi:hypothetical protein